MMLRLRFDHLVEKIRSDLMPRRRPSSAQPGPATLSRSLLNALLVATGGRFEVVHVTTTRSAGTGSFQDAITGGSSRITRIVVFDVSGATYNPLLANDVQRSDTAPRGNLYVAGQTAPPARDGSGRGFAFHGGIRVYQSNIVFEHLRIVPTAGPWRRDIESGGQVMCIPNDAIQNIIFRNCTIKHTTDVNVKVRGNAQEPRAFVQNFVLKDCLIAEPLSQRVGDPQNDYYGGHNFWVQINARSYRVLGHGNLLTSGLLRTPLVSTGSHSLWINNYGFNFGGPNKEPFASKTYGYPCNLDVRSPHGQEKWYHRNNTTAGVVCNEDYLISDQVGNHYEGGPRTRLPQPPARVWLSPVAFEKYQPDGGPTNWGHYFHLADNRVSTWYDEIFPLDTRGDSVCSLTGAERVNWLAPTWQPATHSRFDAAPHYSLPLTPLPSARVRDYALTYAGAWPSARDPGDRRIVSEVAARTNDAVAAAPADAQVTTTMQAVDVPHVGTQNTGRLEGDHALVAGHGSGRITRLEQWLHERHMDALGISQGDRNYDPDIVGRWIASTEEATVT